MIEHTLDAENSILVLRPKSPLGKDDFAQIAKTVDPLIERSGDLAGIIIEFSAFPGWENIGAMAAHLRFVRDHHRHVKKIGIVTDSNLGSVAEHWRRTSWRRRSSTSPQGRAAAARQWITAAG